MVKFSDWLTLELEKRNMSPSDLARASHKAPAVIGRILKGERNPAPETIKDIAGALKLPAELLFKIAVGIDVDKNDSGDLSPTKRQLLHLAEQVDDETAELGLDVLRAAWERKKRQMPANGQRKTT
jgi:transcriptional regulator with XRE-family HTH domain